MIVKVGRPRRPHEPRLIFPPPWGLVKIILDPTVGTEIRKTRSCVVISNNRANEFSPQLTVVPVTAYTQKDGHR